jgi:hypothetical protein
MDDGTANGETKKPRRKKKKKVTEGDPTTGAPETT